MRLPIKISDENREALLALVPNHQTPMVLLSVDYDDGLPPQLEAVDVYRPEGMMRGVRCDYVLQDEDGRLRICCPNRA